MNARCPICKKELKSDTGTPYFPFCSQRCKLVDLNSWLSNGYTISSPIPDEDGEDTENGLE
jgi:endogenous inhibitor of DNA gyrase (YacG/DUF329 family)